MSTPTPTPTPAPTPASAPAVRPKPPNKIEKLKKEKDGLDVMNDIERYAAGGLASVDPTDLEVRFRWLGVYTQKPPEDGFFMMRVRVPNGQVNVRQLRKVADLGTRYARGVADCTTRQCFQYHWLRIESFPTIFRELNEVGLSTIEACGDCPRNVCGCPVAGKDKNEILDASGLTRDLAKALTLKKEFSNLPRKYKISAAGCSIYCHQPEINDVGYTAVRHPDGRIGYTVRVGGGLSVRPHFSQPLGVFFKPEEAVAVGVAITEVFRDFGYREKRNRARLKFLVADWGAEKFRDHVEMKLGRKLERFTEPEQPEDRRTDHVGIYQQKQPGLFYVGAPTQSGRLNSDQMNAIADLAEKYGSGQMALTQKQNVLLFDIPEGKVADVVSGLQILGLDPKASTFRRATVACTGTEFCKLAVVETKARANSIVDYLDSKLDGRVSRDIFISFTGCPNSCAQYQIAEIGMLGQGRKIDGKLTDHYSIHVGGGIGSTQGFGREIGVLVPATQAHLALENLLRGYEAGKQNGESFRQFSRRHDDAKLKELIKTGNALTGLQEFAPEPLDD